MERIVFVLFGFLAIALSAPLPQSDESEVRLIKYHNEHRLDGYSFNYALSDGQEREETGVYKDGKDLNGVDIKVLTVTGHFSFIAPSGMKFTTFYTADENGYRVQKMKSEPIVVVAAGRSSVTETAAAAVADDAGVSKAEVRADADDDDTSVVGDNNEDDDAANKMETTTLAAESE